jgi:hypothetical protein
MAPRRFNYEPNDRDHGHTPPVPVDRPVQLPGVTPELAAAIKALPIPELTPFNKATGEDALKQWGFSMGILHVKMLVAKSLEAQNQNKLTTTVKLPQK